jgi:hypothetical protein
LTIALAHTRGPPEDCLKTVEDCEELDPPIEWAAAAIVFWRCIVLLRATCEKVAGKPIDIAAEWAPLAARVLEAEDEN